MLEPASLTAAPTAPEQPMAPLRHSLYLLLTSVLVGIFYIYCLAAIVASTILSVLMFTYAVLTLYSGGFPYYFHFVRVLFSTAGIFARSLWLRRDERWQIDLTRAEAPQLWSIVEELAQRLDMQSPHKIVLFSGSNAYADLSGIAAGRGKTRIGVGFDLLAGLSPVQARAVMAHEIAHAKYVRRGYSGFIMNGIARIERCDTALQEFIQQGGTFLSHTTLKVLAFLPKQIGKVSWRLMAACWRYEEFKADRVAAEVCGPREMGSALRAIYALAFEQAKIQWRDRLIHLDKAPGYSAWLSGRLEVSEESRRLALEARALQKDYSDELSTHPSLADRLAALEDVAAVDEPWAEGEESNSLCWFLKPDESAQKLLRKIEKNAAEKERKESRTLTKSMKRQGSHSIGRRVQNAAIAVRTGRNDVPLPIPSLANLRLGEQQYTQENRRNSEVEYRSELLSPAEKRLKIAEQAEVKETENRERGARLRAELPLEVTQAKAVSLFWIEKGAEQLSRCNYNEAAHCARLALEARKNMPAAQHIIVVCHAAQGRRQVRHALEPLLKRSPHAEGRWAVAWAKILLRDFQGAEAYLLQLTTENPNSATWWALLGRCQRANSKPREALASHRRALDLAVAGQDSANEACHCFEFAQALLAMGVLDEAKTRLDGLNAQRQVGKLPGVEDFDLQIAWVGWHLAHGETALALQIARELEKKYHAPRHWLVLGKEFSKSHNPQSHAAAREYFGRALEHGFYPQAMFSLATLALEEDDREAARQLLFQSLDVTKATPFDAIPVLWQFEKALGLHRKIAELAPRKVIFFIVRLDTRSTVLEMKSLILRGAFPSTEARNVFLGIGNGMKRKSWN